MNRDVLFALQGAAQQTIVGTCWGDGFATDPAAVAAGVSNPRQFFELLMAKPYHGQVAISPHVYGPAGVCKHGFT